jgi:hypothetical protein
MASTSAAMPFGPSESRQHVLLDLTHIGFKNLTVAVDQAQLSLTTPIGDRLVLLQHDPQTVRKLATHHSPAHPRHGFKGSAHRRKVHAVKGALPIAAPR